MPRESPEWSEGGLFATVVSLKLRLSLNNNSASCYVFRSSEASDNLHMGCPVMALNFIIAPTLMPNIMPLTWPIIKLNTRLTILKMMGYTQIKLILTEQMLLIRTFVASELVVGIRILEIEQKLRKNHYEKNPSLLVIWNMK